MITAKAKRKGQKYSAGRKQQIRAKTLPALVRIQEKQHTGKVVINMLGDKSECDVLEKGSVAI